MNAGILSRLVPAARQPLDLLLEAATREGDVAHVPLWRREGILLAHPRFIAHVLHTNRGNYARGRAGSWLRALWGEGLVLSDGEEWQVQRRLVAPALHAERLKRLAAAMVEETEILLRRWQALADRGEVVGVTTDVWMLTLRVLLRGLFGARDSSRAGALERVVDDLLGHSNERTAALIPPPYGLFTPASLAKRLRARRTLRSLLTAIIRDRRRDPEDLGDVLSMLVTAIDPRTGRVVEERWILDQVMSLLLAGRESTATTLVWCVDLLARHPDVERRLRNEAERVLGDRAPAAADLPRLEYASAVIDETLRLYPPAYKFTRQAKQRDEIGGVSVPAGALVVLSPFVTHRHPALWESPQRFDPDRFSPGRTAERLPYAYFPFGGGSRVCAGRSFALMESLIVLAMIVRRFRFELVSPAEIAPKAALTLQPSRDVVVRLRHQAADRRSTT